MISLISLKDRKACRKPAMFNSKLDDGTELPVHSRLMAHYIPVFYGMLDSGTLSATFVLNKVRTPCSDCSEEEAKHS